MLELGKVECVVEPLTVALNERHPQEDPVLLGLALPEAPIKEGV